MKNNNSKNANKVLVLRTCKEDLTSHNGFKWVDKGIVKAPDWDPKPKCGNGLHGLLWGQGNGGLLYWGPEAKWLVVEVDEDKVVDIDGYKVKFPEGNVIYCGNRKDATDLVASKAPLGTVIVGYMATASDYGTATAGFKGTATAGTDGTATAGGYGTATAGNSGTAIAGDYGTATAGDYGTATAGTYGTATAGTYGTATAGYGGTAIAGDRGTAIAGEYGTIQIKWYDEKNSRDRTIIGYVGDNGIKANVPYVCNEKGELVEKK